MLVAGTIALGLVWGWLAGGALFRRRLRATLVTLGGLVLQGALVPQGVSIVALVCLAGAAALAALVRLAWLRGLMRRALEASG